MKSGKMESFDSPPKYGAHSFPVYEDAVQHEKQSGYPVDAGKAYWTVNNPGACVRTTDLDIFRHGKRQQLMESTCVIEENTDNNCTAISIEDQAGLLDKLKMLYFNEYATPLPIPTPDLETLSQRCLRWVTYEEYAYQETSIIALLTSQHLTVALQGHIDSNLIATFQQFLLSTTLAYTSWRDPQPPSQRLSVRDLHRMSHLTGSALLHQLDSTLYHRPLARASRSELQALFLVVFGTVLGVAYSTLVGSGPPVIRTDLLSKVLAESPTLWMAMKERLCHLLANDLVILAGMLRFSFDPETARNNILEGCLLGRWNRVGRCVWANVAVPPWQQSWSTAGVGGPGGMFQPTPQATVLPSPELLSPLLPGMDGSDGRKRRSMMVVGPSWNGQQMYARMRTSNGSDGPSLFV